MPRVEYRPPKGEEEIREFYDSPLTAEWHGREARYRAAIRACERDDSSALNAAEFREAKAALEETVAAMKQQWHEKLEAKAAYARYEELRKQQGGE